MRLGGFARRSLELSRIRRERSVFRCIWWKRSISLSARQASASSGIGRDPLPEEIAAELGVSPEKVREIMKIAQDPVSLETPIGEEEDSHLGDFIQDDNVPVPAEAAAQTLLKRAA